MDTRNPWEILGIPPTSDISQLREAYLTQVRQHHPDQYRADLHRYQQQEEYMKRINAAYQWALKNPPTTNASEEPRSQTEKTASPTMCPIHHYAAMRQCRQCAQPICLACEGVRESLCTAHYRKKARWRARTRVVKEWGPVLVLVVGMRTLDLPGLDILIAILIYLAVRGLSFLIAHRWLGCLALLLLPYSLVLAGAWSLIQSLQQLHEKTPPPKHSHPN